MAFLKTAKALVQHPGIHAPEWVRYRQQLQRTGRSRVASTINLADQASEILGERFDPSKYLLTHVTIVSSVDTEPVANVKLGSVEEGGRTVLRKFADYHITTPTEQFINNNNDAFSRGVLLKSYRTFVGGHNWLEHVQVVEQSKGRLLDAVARDIGPSVYVDLLVATHRKHAELIRKIESAELTTLSMGCSCTHTTCTKCGNVAYDEVQLCDCIRYAKGNKYFDSMGQQRRIAELCGHESEDPTGGVNFIEASWVEVPAFTGAVMRSIIEPAKLSPKSLKQMQAVLESTPKEWAKDQPQKAAKLETHEQTRTQWMEQQIRKRAQWLEEQEARVVARVRPVAGIKVSGEITSHVRLENLRARLAHIQRLAEEEFDFGDEPSEGAPAEAPGESEDEDELGDLVKDTEKEVLKRVKKQLKDQITPKQIEPSLEEGTPSTSNNIIKDGTSRGLKRVVFEKRLRGNYDVMLDGTRVGMLFSPGRDPGTNWRAELGGFFTDNATPKKTLEGAHVEDLMRDVQRQLGAHSMFVRKGSAEVSQYLAGLGAIVAISKSSHELLDNVFRYHEACGRPISKRLHRAASMAVASSQPFSKACVRALGRQPSEGELQTIIRLGRLLNLRTT